MPDVGNAEVYLAGAVAIVAEYPIEVMEKLSDPRTGSRVLKDYPSLISIRHACGVLFEPMEREAERQAARHSHVAGYLPRSPRTPEQQARIDAQVARAKQEIAAAAAASEPTQVEHKAC